VNATLGGKESLLKGAVLGGMEKDFSPLKTRNARKLEKDKEKLVVEKVLVAEGPQGLRDQKALARVK
jgi:hypothetical protein